MDAYLLRLRALEERFAYYKAHLAEIIDEQRKCVVRTVITNGVVANHTPYYAERVGEKLRSKPLKAAVASDHCRQNHYDQEGRLILVEEYSVFLGSFQVNEIFRYGALAERLLIGAAGLMRLDEFDHPFADTEVCLSFAGANGYIVEEFRYVVGILTEINEKRPALTRRIGFQYEDNQLVQIVLVCENGYRELLYTTKKPNFALIRRDLTEQLVSLTGGQDNFSCIGIEGFLDQTQPMICICLAGERKPPALIADWGRPMVAIPVYDYQFSDAQLKKCVKLIAEILVQLVEEGCLTGKGIWFHQNQVSVGELYPGVRKVFQSAGVEIF